MANKTSANPRDSSIIETFVDLGDGTFALKVVTAPSSASEPAAAVSGQVVIAVSGTAVQLPSNVLTSGVIVKSKVTNNAARAVIGKSGLTFTVDGTGNGYIVEPGEAASFGVNNTNLIYVNGTAGDIFSFCGS